ncbi:MAG TPA: aminotransferase class IV [Clostridia bacterium]|nr:aminotransferase class IV [Clostridia bacterium]
MTVENILINDENKVLAEPIIYEVIRVIHEKPLFLKEHLERMASSLKYYSTVPLDFSLIEERIFKVIEKNSIINQNIRIEVGNITKDSFAYKIFPVESFYPSRKVYGEGVTVVTALKNRKNPLIKAKDLSFKGYVNEILETTKAFEVILKDEKNKLHEGSRSNLFFINNNLVITSKKGDALEGITLKNVIKVIEDSDYKFQRKDIYMKDLENLDGAFITGTSIDILPIKKIDKILYNSADNPVILDLMDKFKKLKLKDIGGM